MKMKYVSMMAVIALLGIHTPVHAAEAAAPAAEASQVVIVDVKKIATEAKAPKAIQEQIEAERKKVQADVTKQEEALRKEDQKLAEQRSVLSADAFEAKRKEFKEKVVAAQRSVQQHRTKLENAYAQAMGDVQKQVVGIIAEMAAQRKFTVVVPSSQVLYYDQKLDITAEVMKKLDEKLPKVDVKL
ncbi:MAG: OmpH family outer membrane protein [Proteobacteria bacterium]|nr:OmpH family outer membrane protein [Pseudomonadota bacterium]